MREWNLKIWGDLQRRCKREQERSEYGQVEAIWQVRIEIFGVQPENQERRRRERREEQVAVAVAEPFNVI
jgi:hypothetical protein